MSTLTACIEIHCVHAWCSQRPEEFGRCPGSGFTKNSKVPPCSWNKAETLHSKRKCKGESAPNYRAISPGPLHILNVRFIPSLISFVMTLPF